MAGWNAALGENPADRLGGNPHATAVVNTVADGPITDGGTTDGDIASGAIATGALAPTGPAALNVNGKALPNTPVLVP